MKFGAIIGVALILTSAGAKAEDQTDLRAEIECIKQQLAQMDDLKARLARLEQKLAESDAARANPQPVMSGYPSDRVKLDGRIFVGTFATGAQGPARYWSTAIPDAKLRLTFIPSEQTTFVARLTANETTVNGFDFLYLDYVRLPFASSTLRVGQRKVEVGLETQADNPIEDSLITNSASHVAGYATGISLFGTLGCQPRSPCLAVGFVNGPKPVQFRPTNGLPFNVRLAGPVGRDLFAAATWFDTGPLRHDDNSAVTIAQIVTAPPGAIRWRRTLWEYDLRYGYGPNGTQSMIPMKEPPRFRLGGCVGAFQDTSVGAPDRDGVYWFAESLVRLSPRAYAAARYSVVKLDDDTLARLNDSPVPVNSYTRTSIGLGYIISDLTQLKTEYTLNDASGGATTPSLNLWSLGVASKF